LGANVIGKRIGRLVLKRGKSLASGMIWRSWKPARRQMLEFLRRLIQWRQKSWNR
jgi:hypothetical protein